MPKQRRLPPPPDRPELDEALKRGRERWDEMDFEEQEAELREQQKSHARQDKD